jgi:hypothetical protein
LEKRRQILVIIYQKQLSDLAQALIKSEYNFDFLGISDEVHEKR